MIAIGNGDDARIDALLGRFGLSRYRELILANARPCIAIALPELQPGPPHRWPPPPPGASKAGGLPDLPADWHWPRHAQGPSGFFLQIALADLPRAEWNPLPAQGILYLFCCDDAAAQSDDPGWLLRWSGASPQTLTRQTRPEAFPATLQQSYFSDSVSYPLVFRAGTDLPPGSQGDRPFIDAFVELARAGDDEDALNRYFEFKVRAADPGYEADLARGFGPYHHPVGQLLGHTDPSVQSELKTATERADWRQFIRLESNPTTGYLSPFDAAPVQLLAGAPRSRPWLPTGPIHGFARK